MPLKIVSGGQTGVDRAALDMALELGLSHGGWCPRGRRAEDGPIAARYQMQETPNDDYWQRTEWNVRDSDGTLILCWERPTGGTAYTVQCTEKWKKPVLIFDLAGRWSQKRRSDFQAWVTRHRIQTLNIAGPRESRMVGRVYRRAIRILRRLMMTGGR